MQISEHQRRLIPDDADVQAASDQQAPVDGTETAAALAKPKQQTVTTLASTAEEQTEAGTELDVPGTDEGLQAMQKDAQ